MNKPKQSSQLFTVVGQCFSRSYVEPDRTIYRLSNGPYDQLDKALVGQDWFTFRERLQSVPFVEQITMPTSQGIWRALDHHWRE